MIWFKTYSLETLLSLETFLENVKPPVDRKCAKNPDLVSTVWSLSMYAEFSQNLTGPLFTQRSLQLMTSVEGQGKNNLNDFQLISW